MTKSTTTSGVTKGLTRAKGVARGEGTEGGEEGNKGEGGERCEEKFLRAGGPTIGTTRGPRRPK